MSWSPYTVSYQAHQVFFFAFSMLSNPHQTSAPINGEAKIRYAICRTAYSRCHAYTEGLRNRRTVTREAIYLPFYL